MEITLEQLKAAAYDTIGVIELNQNRLKQINAEIARRSQPEKEEAEQKEEVTQE